MNFEEISTDWDVQSKLYNDLGRFVATFVKQEITNYELLPELSYRTKDLLSIIKKIKKKKIERPDYSLNDLKDKLGLRIICPFSTDLNMVDKFIKANFIIEKAEYKRDDLNFDKLDYTSNHYDLMLNPKNKKLFKPRFRNLIFELQVRSLNQHAWSNTAHILTYKRESNIPDNLKRRVYRLLSLYEIADDEFSAVNAALSEQEDSAIYNILRILESKTYKYAKVDYDRDISLFYLNRIFENLNAEQIQSLKNEVLDFIEINDRKIQKIFELNRSLFYKFSFLTQPEIFIVWYAIEKFYFKIESIFVNELDEDEFEDIKAIWG